MIPTWRAKEQVKRQSKNAASSLEHRLSAYALAASAAGVGMLALANAAEAKIVYTRADVGIAPPDRAPLDLNHDGKTDFFLRDTYFTFFGGANALLSVAPARGANQIAGYSRGGHYASALASGAPIGSKAPFGAGAEVMARAVFTGITGACYGAWANVQNRYLGLRFSIKGKIHYGWARLSVSCPSKVISATLTGYAYETIPNKPIIAGKTKGPDVTVEPPGLGDLARGVSGLSAWRRTNSVAAPH